MGNVVTVKLTEFVDINKNEKTGGYERDESIFGVRVYDDYHNTYITVTNNWDTFANMVTEDKGEKSFPERIIHLLHEEANDPVRDMLDFIRINANGIQINDSHYEWDEIKGAFDAEES